MILMILNTSMIWMILMIVSSYWFGCPYLEKNIKNRNSLKKRMIMLVAVRFTEA